MSRPRRRPAPLTPAPTVASVAVDTTLPALGTAAFRDLALTVRGQMSAGRARDSYADLLRRYIGLPVPGPRDRADLAAHAGHPVLAHLNAAISARSALDPRWYVEDFAPTAPR